MAGRPSSYRKEFNEQVTKLARLGATEPEIADFFGVAPATITNWKDKHPEFLAALKRGKLEADAEVSNSLFKRANGYTWVEDQAVTLKEVEYANGKRARETQRVEIVSIEKRVPPDTTACIFWLKNRRKEDWRDKREIDWHEKRDPTDYTRDELEEVIRNAGNGRAGVAAASGREGSSNRVH